MIIVLLTPFSKLTPDYVLDELDYPDNVVFFWMTTAQSMVCPPDTISTSYSDFLGLVLNSRFKRVTKMVVPSSLNTEMLIHAQNTCNRVNVELTVI